MRLVALLSWYDEPAEWLTELACGLAAAGVDELVALDGAYELYPYGRARSSTDEAHALVAACAGAGMGLTLRQPSTVWSGNELEKRTALFELGHQVAQPEDDWFWVCDGDEVVTEALDVRRSLEGCDLDAASCRLWWPTPGGDKGYKWVRKFFRAQWSGIRVERNHWTYVTGDGRYLWGWARERVPDLRLWEVLVEHRAGRRTAPRNEAQQTYYREREDRDLEELGPPLHVQR